MRCVRESRMGAASCRSALGRMPSEVKHTGTDTRSATAQCQCTSAKALQGARGSRQSRTHATRNLPFRPGRMLARQHMSPVRSATLRSVR